MPKRRARQGKRAKRGWRSRIVPRLSREAKLKRQSWLASWAFYVNGLQTREYEGR
jgi:hypothetical protein